MYNTLTITLTLVGSDTGTWRVTGATRDSLVWVGIMFDGIPSNDNHAVAAALHKPLLRWLDASACTDANVQCIDPYALDLLGEPVEDGKIICAFRLLDGEFTCMVSH